MRNTMLILFAFMMVIVSACSNAGRAQTSNEGLKINNEQVKNGTGTTSKGETSGAKNSKEKKTIVFSTYFYSDFFSEAKKRYEAKHPNITIELQYIDKKDNELTEADYEKFEKKTNAAMLSGKGPDLIQMDQLPSGDYVKKNLLANIGDMIDKDPTFKKEQYFSNVLDGIKVNGGIYGMPMGFFIYGLIGNETVIEKSGVKIDDSHWTWKQFTEKAKEIANKAGGNHFALGGMAPEHMIGNLVTDQYATFVDLESRKANFDSAVFIELLKEVKFMFDEKMIREDYEGGIFYNAVINSPEYYIREVRSSEYFSDPYKKKSKLYSKPNASGQQEGGFFRTYRTIGINERSAVKGEAWDFIKFMLSDEMQDHAGSSGISLHKASYKKVAQDVLKKGTVMSDQPVGPLKGKEFKVTQKDIDDLEKFITRLKYPVQFKPSKIEEILLEESKAYFTGQKSPEAVAKLIQNRVTTVLNE
ncbi:ABC transporter substrate-binding protein [Paenibacillus sp. SC116]|uniref:ABC transporter substrate-binding protein n=1 Tax=Paenibacillus sp. SC116 TaxID=2968986 RepID=UPI00215B265C|nr:ABC transporter substrate-binding protein [Paenibacillus sp. SC116]MCR8844455.1 ABC transporter substrate-binding protein [Paenibacillus sp. SC116]